MADEDNKIIPSGSARAQILLDAQDGWEKRTSLTSRKDMEPGNMGSNDLFPDLNAYDNWSKKVTQLQKELPGTTFGVSGLIEKYASKEEI